MHGVLPIVPRGETLLRADPNSYSLFTHNYAEGKNKKEGENKYKIMTNEDNKTESVFMTNNAKRETKSSVSAFSY